MGEQYLLGEKGVRFDLIRHFRYCSIGFYAMKAQGAKSNGGFRFQIALPPYKYKRKGYIPRVTPSKNMGIAYNAGNERYYYKGFRGFQCTKLNLQCKFITHETYPFDGYKIPEKSVRDIWLSTDEIKAIRDVKVSRENRIRKYLRNLYMFIHFIYLIFFYYFCSK